MLSTAENQLGRNIGRVVVGSNSPKKEAGFTNAITGLETEKFVTGHIRVEAVDPETWGRELLSEDVKDVASQKRDNVTENLERSDVYFPTVVVTGDVVTTVNGESVHRLIRSLEIDTTLPIEAQWQQLEEQLEKDKAEMIARCCNGNILLEWSIGVAAGTLKAEAADGPIIKNRGALVVRAVFSPFTEEVVSQAYAIPPEVDRTQAPDLETLRESVTALDIGPRLDYTALGFTHPVSDVFVGNEGEAINIPIAWKYVVGLAERCELPPQAMLQLLEPRYPSPETNQDLEEYEITFMRVVLESLSEAEPESYDQTSGTTS